MPRCSISHRSLSNSDHVFFPAFTNKYGTFGKILTPFFIFTHFSLNHTRPSTTSCVIRRNIPAIFVPYFLWIRSVFFYGTLFGRTKSVRRDRKGGTRSEKARRMFQLGPGNRPDPPPSFALWRVNRPNRQRAAGNTRVRLGDGCSPPGTITPDRLPGEALLSERAAGGE